jgi:hypothetical protein
MELDAASHLLGCGVGLLLALLLGHLLALLLWNILAVSVGNLNQFLLLDIVTGVVVVLLAGAGHLDVYFYMRDWKIYF